MAGQEFTTSPRQAPPTLSGFGCIGRLAEHLTFKNQHRITAQDRCDFGVDALPNRQSLRFSQHSNELHRIFVTDRALINAANANAVGDSSLLQQTAASRRG